MQFLVFTLDENQFALPVTIVERVIHAVAITPVSEEEGIISGLINMEGEIINVVNLRRCMNLPEREIKVSDRFIITRRSDRDIALIVDDVADIFNMKQEDVRGSDLFIENPVYINGALKTGNGLIPVLNIEGFNFSHIDNEENNM